MIKTKITTGLAMVIAALALTATPAVARFTNHGGKGKGTGGAATFTYESVTVRCAGSTANYKVNPEGTSLSLEGVSWHSCLSTIGAEAIVTCKTLEMKQPFKEGDIFGAAQGTITETCTLSSAGCVITIGTEGNKELNSIDLTAGTFFLHADVNISGMTATTNGNIACSLGGATKTKTTVAKEKTEFTLEGVTLE